VLSGSQRERYDVATTHLAANATSSSPHRAGGAAKVAIAGRDFAANAMAPLWPFRSSVERSCADVGERQTVDDSSTACGSGCSSCSEGSAHGSASLMLGSWMFKHLPAFICGAIATCALQSLVPQLLSVGANRPTAQSGCPELRHMVQALHAEVEAARRALAECSSRAQIAVAGPPAVVVRPGTIDLRVGGVGEPSSMHAAPGPKRTRTALFAQLVRAMWAFAVLLLDTGLVYFCMRLIASQAMKSYIEACLVGALKSLKLLCPAWLCPAKALNGGSLQASSAPIREGVHQHAFSELSRIDPSGGSFLVRRVDRPEPPPPNARCQRHLPEHSSEERHHRLAVGALAVASLACVAVIRLATHAADFAGLRFLQHFFAYAVITTRVCLIVLLILF